MILVVKYANKKQQFQKDFVTIGSSLDNDFVLNLGFEFLFTLQYCPEKEAFILFNSSLENTFSVSNKPLPKKCLVKKGCRIFIANSSENIVLKVIADGDKDISVLDVPNSVQMEDNTIPSAPYIPQKNVFDNSAIESQQFAAIRTQSLPLKSSPEIIKTVLFKLMAALMLIVASFFIFEFGRYCERHSYRISNLSVKSTKHILRKASGTIYHKILRRTKY